MMMFGGPSHRLPAQIQATARVLDISLSCMYLPDMMLISFDDPTTGTSSLKLVRQGGAFDIAKLQAAFKLYWKVRPLPPPLSLPSAAFCNSRWCSGAGLAGTESDCRSSTTTSRSTRRPCSLTT